MRVAMITFAAAFAGNMMAGVSAQQPQQPLPQAETAAPAPEVTPEAINGARLQDLLTATRSGRRQAADPARPRRRLAWRHRRPHRR
jgi:hypothetical protein